MNQLVEDVKTLKATSEDSAIKFGELGLKNLQIELTWIESNFTDLRYHLIIDPLLMLESIYGDYELDSGSLMKTMESRLKLKIETGAEVSALNALRHARPCIFHKGRPSMIIVTNKSRLNLLAAYNDWRSGAEGVKSFIVNKMNILHALISKDIGFAFGSDPASAKAYLVATACLTSTVTFITQLLQMVDGI